MRADPLLAGELKTFYGRFECNGGSSTESSRQSSNDCNVNYVIAMSEDEVRRELNENIRKVAGPDGITGRVLSRALHGA